MVQPIFFFGGEDGATMPTSTKLKMTHSFRLKNSMPIMTHHPTIFMAGESDMKYEPPGWLDSLTWDTDVIVWWSFKEVLSPVVNPSGAIFFLSPVFVFPYFLP